MLTRNRVEITRLLDEALTHIDRVASSSPTHTVDDVFVDAAVAFLHAGRSILCPHSNWQNVYDDLAYAITKLTPLSAFAGQDLQRIAALRGGERRGSR